MTKVTVIGTGQIGESTAQQLAHRNVCSEIVLIGRDDSKAKGIALDIQHSSPIYDSNSYILGTTDYQELKDSNVVVIAAGISRKPGMSRFDLLESNIKIIKNIVANILEYAPDAYIVIVTNPIDIITHLVWKLTGWDRSRIIGLSGILDSARMASLISKISGYSVREISALVIGGHGDHMVPLIRFSAVNGIPINNLLNEEQLKEIVARTRSAGGDIVKYKGKSGFIAASASLVSMVDAIINDRNHILPCVAILNGEYGYKDIALGVSTVIGKSGVTKIIELSLNSEEKSLLDESAREISDKIGKLKL